MNRNVASSCCQLAGWRALWMRARTVNTENGHISVGKVQASSNEPAERSFFSLFTVL
jgi:hypothetical protein